MQAIIYMLLTNDRSYLIRLGEKDYKSSQQKNENKTFYKKLLTHSPKIFLQKSM